MKKLVFVAILTLFIIHQSYAQQNKKVSHMVITIVKVNALTIGKPNNMFITRDDTTQVQKWVDLKSHGKLRDQAADFETVLMQLIEPYYEQGWKLVTTSTEAVTDNTSINTETFRYYLIKNE